MRNEMMLFEKEGFGEIRIVYIGEDIWFVGADVAKALGYSATGAMSKLIDDDDKFLRNIQNGTNYLNQLLINESGLYAAIFGSTLSNAKAFKKWITSEVLPSIRKTGAYAIKTPLTRKEEFELGVSALEASSRLLRMSDISKLSCLKHLCISMNVSTEGLPKYLPRKSHILSATELLKRRGKPMSIHVFNSKMIAAKLLEIRERPSSNGQEVRMFKAITELGSFYGENSVNPDYPLETQPHYYEDKFDLLLDFLNENVADNILD